MTTQALGHSVRSAILLSSRFLIKAAHIGNRFFSDDPASREFAEATNKFVCLEVALPNNCGVSVSLPRHCQGSMKKNPMLMHL
jgi:hypothetical protein